MRLLITSKLGTIDYTHYVVDGTFTIEDSINVPTIISFQLEATDNAFVVPPRSSYITVTSDIYASGTGYGSGKILATGFVTNEPERIFLGLNPRLPKFTFQQYQYNINVTSDEWILNSNTIPYIPAFVNQTDSQILAAIADAILPGFFDTSMMASGTLIPFFQYDPSQTWSDIAKTFADGNRYYYKVLNKKIIYQPFGDASLGISYNEATQNQSQFNPFDLKTGVITIPPVNDCIVIGDAEPQTNWENYYIGDGFSSNFQLRHQVFEGTSASLLSDDWTETSFTQGTWLVNDPQNVLSLADSNGNALGSLNVIQKGNTGVYTPQVDATFVQAQNGIELGGGLSLQHGQFIFNDSCNGLVGCIFGTDTFIPGNVLAGFGITGQPAMGPFTVAQVQIVAGNSPLVTLVINGTIPANLQVGNVFTCAGFGGASFLNGSQQTIVSLTQGTNQYYIVAQGKVVFSSPYGPTNDTGTISFAANDTFVTASGSAGVIIQPIFNGKYVGQQVVSQVNHQYVLETWIGAQAPSRYTRPYTNITKTATYGNQFLAASGSLTFVVTDVNLGDFVIEQQNPLFGLFPAAPPPLVTQHTEFGVVLPPFALYCLLNGINLNTSINYTLLSYPPQGYLTVQSLTGMSGGNLPWLPSELSKPIVYQLGFGQNNQTAQIAQQGEAYELSFYTDDIPAVGARIVFQSWAVGQSIARVRDPIAVAAEAQLAGDSGVRSAIMSNLSPIPRTSDECEAAAAAAILDREYPQFQGTYTVKTIPYKFESLFSPASADYPRTGRYLNVYSPQRAVIGQSQPTTQLTIPGTSEPWNPDGSFHDSLPGTGPVTIPVTSGNVITINYISGEIFWGDFEENITPEGAGAGSSGSGLFPWAGDRIDGSYNSAPGFLDRGGGLLGAFVDSTNSPVATPVWVGESFVSLPAPSNAVAFSLGTNTRYNWANNTGSWVVNYSISGANIPPVGQNFLINTSRIQVVEWKQEVLQVSLDFGMDLYLEKLLPAFLEREQNLLVPQQTAVPPNFITIDEVLNASLSTLDSAHIVTIVDSLTGNYVTVDLGVPPITACEVRNVDSGWGAPSQGRVGYFTTQVFTLPRTVRDQTWYLRQVNGDIFSRFSKALRVVYPLVPSAPGLQSVTSSAIVLALAGDVRDIYGLEVRVTSLTGVSSLSTPINYQLPNGPVNTALKFQRSALTIGGTSNSNAQVTFAPASIQNNGNGVLSVQLTSTAIVDSFQGVSVLGDGTGAGVGAVITQQTILVDEGGSGQFQVPITVDVLSGLTVGSPGSNYTVANLFFQGTWGNPNIPNSDSPPAGVVHLGPIPPTVIQATNSFNLGDIVLVASSVSSDLTFNGLHVLSYSVSGAGSSSPSIGWYDLGQTIPDTVSDPSNAGVVQLYRRGPSIQLVSAVIDSLGNAVVTANGAPPFSPGDRVIMGAGWQGATTPPGNNTTDASILTGTFTVNAVAGSTFSVIVPSGSLIPVSGNLFGYAAQLPPTASPIPVTILENGGVIQRPVFAPSDLVIDLTDQTLQAVFLAAQGINANFNVYATFFNLQWDYSSLLDITAAVKSIINPLGQSNISNSKSNLIGPTGSTSNTYTIGCTYDGSFPPNFVLVRVPLDQAISFNTDFFGCEAWLDTPASSSLRLSIQKAIGGSTLQVEVGNMTFASGSHTCTFSASGGTPFWNINDRLYVVTPNTIDASAKDIGFALKASKLIPGSN